MFYSIGKVPRQKISGRCAMKFFHLTLRSRETRLGKFVIYQVYQTECYSNHARKYYTHEISSLKASFPRKYTLNVFR